ncbi:rhodanese-like domain-containing protein [Formosa sp. A9]|uniref:rhodanese-like domain-containing protein n=1 Tax=Formosa sp. A9 TaxID=3442641 RepID=UPI003EBB0F97
MRKLVYICITVVLLCQGCKESETATIEVVTSEEMQSLLSLDEVQVVDVRTPEERLTDGYLKASQNIDYNSPTFAEDIALLDKTKPVVLYCGAGGRSTKCAEKLKAAGFVKIYDLQGGISEWKHKGYPVEYTNN